MNDLNLEEDGEGLDELNQQFDENEDLSKLDRGDNFTPTDDDVIAPQTGAKQSAAEQDDDLNLDDLEDLAGGDKPRMVPHSRFNEVNESYKTERQARLALEEELARLKGGQAPAEQQTKQEEPPAETGPSLKELRKLHREALYAGDDDKADELEDQMEALRQASAERIADERAAKARQEWEQQQQQQAASATLNQVVSNLNQLYPFLDPEKKDQYNQAKVDETLEWMQFYELKGVARPQALQMAAERLHGKPAEPAATGSKTQTAGMTAEQVQRNLERDRRQPPEASSAGIGERSQRIDYSKISDEDLSRMSEDDKRKARGDFL